MQVHESGGNIGWAAGNNFGIRVAIKEGCTNFLLLNPDIILDQNMIANLVAASHEYPDAALFGAVVLSKTNRNWIEFGGSYIDKKSGFPSYVSKNAEEFDLLPNTERVPVVKGCAMMITQLGIERIGMFDESYFLNFDETDWCFKALKKKYDTILVKDSIVYHQGAVSFEGTDSPIYRYFIARNRLIFAKNHKDVVNRVIAWRASLWEFKRAIIKKDLTIFCKLLLEIAIFISIYDYIFGNYGDCPKIIRKISKKYNSLK
jgi:GT2 family glycosyltransferase